MLGKYFSSLTPYEDEIQGPEPCPRELRLYTVKLEGKISVSMEMVKLTQREKFHYAIAQPFLACNPNLCFHHREASRVYQGSWTL